MRELQDEISDLLSTPEEDRFSCPKETRKKAMDLLARREHGQSELIRKLADKGYDFSIAEQAVHDLTSEGLQSDLRFADNYVQSRVHQGKGPVRIRMDLGKKGISDSVVETALEEAATDWYALAKDAKRKKFGHGRAVDFKNKAKQMRFLQYRGFEQDHIRTAVGEDD